MDKKTIIGFVLIMVINLEWTNMLMKPQKPTEQPQTVQDTVATSATPETTSGEVPEETKKTLVVADSATSAALQEPSRTITVETQRAIYTLSTRGGTLTQVILKDYMKHDSLRVSLLSSSPDPGWASHGALTLGYADNFPDFNYINFRVDGNDLHLTKDDSTGSVIFTYTQPDSAIIIKKYTFSYTGFPFDLDIDLKMPKKLDLGQGVTIGWFAPMEPTEENINDDKSKLGGFFSMGGDFDYFNSIKNGSLRKIVTGPVDWVATRTKYFTAVIMAESSPAQEAIVVGSNASIVDAAGTARQWSRFGTGMTYDRPADDLSLKFSVYTGPLDYDKLRGMGNNLSSLVDMGWKPFRPFAIAILWVFTSLHSFIPNYGFVIIVFSILMKLVFWPLSVKSARSMHRMREIQPRLQEVKEKYKGEPAKLQQETMKVYKEFGVNPFGSCLPMLVQLPIFWALYSVLSNTIELRGAEFIFWIHDLSQPDPSGKLIPFGIGILPIIMGVSMFIQQKITITDPKQKLMIYLMPVLFTFLFSRWASGLVLYWTMFNIMGIFEQMFVKRNLEAAKTA